jgi:hypothetical protein
MPELVARITVFVGSPGDVGPERLAVQEVVQDLNDAFAGFGNFVVEARTWERHAWPGFGTDAQDVINREVGEYDIFVGLFWNRLGTPTPRAPSGTAEEFTRAYKLWEVHRSPTLMLYFRTSPAPLDTDDEVEQRRQLLGFKTQVRGMGALAFEYGTPEELRRLVTKHLIKELLSIERTLDIEHLNRRLTAQERALTVQDEKLQRQQHAINVLSTYSMGEHIYRHLRALHDFERNIPGHVPEYKFWKYGPMWQEIRFLVDHGYIELLNPDDLPDQADLTRIVRLTPVGNYYVELREEAEGAAKDASPT